MFTFFVFYQKHPFWANLVKKFKIVSFKVKLDTYTYSNKSNSNMQNLMMLFTFFVFDRKYHCWANLVQNIKIVSLRLKLTPKLIAEIW